MGLTEMNKRAAVKTLFDSLGLFDSFEEFVHGLAGGRSAPSSRVRPGRLKDGQNSGGMHGRDRERIARVVRKAPEVMVKVSSVAKQAGRVWAHLTYITRNGRISAENDEGECLAGIEDLKELHGHWSEQIGKRRANGKQAVNMVLSMPAGTNPERLKEAARDFVRQVFANHEYVFVLHTPDTDPDPEAPPQPHVHVCVKARGKNGQPLVHGKPQLQEWRELFAERLRERGIDAAATPRHVRGVVKKPMRQPVYQANKRGRSAVKHSTLRAAARSLIENASESRPWEEKIARKQEQIREGWTALADALERGANYGDADLAQQVRIFLMEMPMPLTERQQIELGLRSAVRASEVERGLSGAAERERSHAPNQPSMEKGKSIVPIGSKFRDKDCDR
jgi:hypothetical protein